MKRTMRTLAFGVLTASLLAGSLAGCAGNNVWVRPSEPTTQRDFMRDRYECSYNAQMVSGYWNPNVGIFSGAMVMMSHFRDCMNARGYIQVSEDEMRAMGMERWQ
jgi:hypothetical protein